MDKPNMEDMFYCHIELMSAMMRAMEKQFVTTIFNNGEIADLIKGLGVGLSALQLEFDRAYEDFNDRKSVCY